MQVKVEYTQDYCSRSGDDQNGRVIVTTPTGRIHARWECEGGMGSGATVDENTTTEYTDDEADDIVNCTDICQGVGDYEGDLHTDEYGWWTLTDVQWPQEAT